MLSGDARDITKVVWGTQQYHNAQQYEHSTDGVKYSGVLPLVWMESPRQMKQPMGEKQWLH